MLINTVFDSVSNEVSRIEVIGEIPERHDRLVASPCKFKIKNHKPQLPKFNLHGSVALPTVPIPSTK